DALLLCRRVRGARPQAGDSRALTGSATDDAAAARREVSQLDGPATSARWLKSPEVDSNTVHGLRDHVLSDLLWSDLADNFYGAPLLTVIAGLVLLVAPLLWLRFDGASLVALLLFELVALLVALRFRIPRRLSRSGVAVD